MKTLLSPHPRAAGAAVILTALLAAGCGSGATHRSDRPAAAATATTLTAAGTAAHRQASARKGTTVYAVARATPQRSHPPRIAAGRVLRTFAGSGPGTLGSVSEKTPVVIEWHATAPHVQLLTGPGFLLVDSHARTGRITLARGSYTRLRISTPQAWTIELRVAG